MHIWLLSLYFFCFTPRLILASYWIHILVGRYEEFHVLVHVSGWRILWGHWIWCLHPCGVCWFKSIWWSSFRQHTESWLPSDGTVFFFYTRRHTLTHAFMLLFFGPFEIIHSIYCIIPRNQGPLIIWNFVWGKKEKKW